MEMPSLSGGLQIPEYPGDYFHYVFMKILMAGRANGLQVIDGPYVKVRDPEGFREFCKRTQVLGYDGKWALHPDQVTILNEVFSPTQEQFDKAWNVLDAYKDATEGDRKGAVMFGDEMIDEASRKVAIKLVAKGERAGLTPQRMTIDAVVPARDEAPTVADVVIRACSNASYVRPACSSSTTGLQTTRASGPWRQGPRSSGSTRAARRRTPWRRAWPP